MGLMVDSSVVIEAERKGQTAAGLVAEIIDAFGDVQLSLSMMSVAELCRGCWRTGSARRRAAREGFIESILAVVPAFPLDLPTARIFGRIDAELAATGRRLPTSDLLIASTAIARGDDIVTGNPRHFDRVPGLTVHRYR